MPEPVTYLQPDGTKQIRSADGSTVILCEHNRDEYDNGFHVFRRGACIYSDPREVTPSGLCDGCCEEYEARP